MSERVPTAFAAYWHRFVASGAGSTESRLYEAFCFGDSELMANELADLVLRGIKRATASALWTFAAEGKRPPRPGDLSIVTDWAGQPLCVIETEVVEIVPFRDVTEEFAAREGEGDGSLAFWRRAHRDFFTRRCAANGRDFDEEMLVVCERFRVVYRD